MGRLFARSLAILAAALAVLVTPVPAEERPTLYQQAVHILGGNGNVVSRWHDPIRFLAVGFEDPGSAARVVEAAAALAGSSVAYPVGEAPSAQDYARVLGETQPYSLWHPCEGGGERSCVNFVAVRTNASTMKTIADTVPLPAVHVAMLEDDPGVACFFYAFRDGRLRIRQAMVFINESLDGPMLETCLNEEIHQAFGLFGDYTDSADFSFNNVVAPKAITVLDRLLLKALYDERVKAGYPVHHVATIFLEYVEQAGLAR